MIKLKEIKINGIRGFRYLQDKEMKPTPHIIKLNEKHLFLYGENGTGKSSFCDALEWGFTGKMEESDYRRTDEKGLLINSFCPDDKIPSIEIQYFENNKSKKFFREAKKGNIAFDLEDEAKVCFIESTRIERFVISTTKTKWDRFSELLGFENLVTFDDKLKRLKKHTNDKCSAKQKIFDASADEISNLKNDIYKLNCDLSTIFGNNWANIIKSNDYINQNEEYIHLKELSSNMERYIVEYNKLENLDNTIIDIEAKLDEERQKTPTSEISKIIEASFNYFQSIEDLRICPVCGNEIKFDDTSNRITKLKSSLDKILSCERDLNVQRDERKYKEKGLNELEILIRKLYKYANDVAINDALSREKFIEFMILKKDSIEKEKDQLGKINSQNKMISDYLEKTKILSEKKLKLEEIRKDLEISDRLSRDLSSFYELYSKKYSDIIKRELESICDHEITEVYNAINKSNDEIVEKFSINVDIDKKEIDFFINMKGLPDRRPALNILSTGHIRCLGFALLIARIKIKAKKIGFVIIDDPIYSIDHEHRYNLIQYLKTLGESYQLIITSSDRLFSDLIRNSFDDNIFTFYKTKVTKRDGIVFFKLRDKSRYRNYIREAEEHLKAKDFRAASLYARLSLETRIFDLARKMKIMIPYDRIEKHSMRDIMQYGLQDLLIKAYPINETEIKKEFDELTKPGYFKTLLDGFPLDPEVHHPHENRTAYCQQEIEDALNKIKHFDKFMGHLSDQK